MEDAYTPMYTPGPGSEVDDNHFTENMESGGQNPLTRIHDGIHLNTTPEIVNTGEQDKITINNFLHTLSEIALSIASRQKSDEVKENKID